MKKYVKGIGFYVLLFFIILMIFVMTSMPSQKTQEIYSDLVLKIQNQEVAELQITENVAVAKLKDGTVLNVEIPSYESLKSDVGNTMQEQVKSGALKVETPLPYSPPWWLTLLPTVGFLIIIIVFWFLFMQQSSVGAADRGVMNFGKSKARMDG